MTPRADRPGQLPAPDAATIAGVALPNGKWIVADPGFDEGNTSDAVMWMSAAPLADIAASWHPLAQRFAETGLWPLVLGSLDQKGQRPWGDGELAPASCSDPAQADVEQLLAEWWSRGVPVPEEREEAFIPLAPFGREFPGLAIASDEAEQGGAIEAALADLRGNLGLVAVTRPADALAVIGWQGPVNHYDDMGALSAVLRTWEDRFGAYLVGVGFDTITLAATRPPCTMTHALAIAAEHFAICSDIVYQGAGTIDALAESLIDAPTWSFWWD
ncbi:MAG TPA: DUF4253 domain-containing protein [Nannocystaceae bacterium]|nr:DUF4253 domain-containing protein [Nannocystaceae bacterium]